MIIGYESNPVKQIVALGRISAEQDGEKLFFEKVEGLPTPIDYAALKSAPNWSGWSFFRMHRVVCSSSPEANMTSFLI